MRTDRKRLSAISRLVRAAAAAAWRSPARGRDRRSVSVAARSAGRAGSLAAVDQRGDARGGGGGTSRQAVGLERAGARATAASAANSSAPICSNSSDDGGGQVGVAGCRAPDGVAAGGWRPADRRRARRSASSRRDGVGARRRGAPGRGGRPVPIAYWPQVSASSTPEPQLLAGPVRSPRADGDPGPTPVDLDVHQAHG